MEGAGTGRRWGGLLRGWRFFIGESSRTQRAQLGLAADQDAKVDRSHLRAPRWFSATNRCFKSMLEPRVLIGAKDLGDGR